MRINPFKTAAEQLEVARGPSDLVVIWLSLCIKVFSYPILFGFIVWAVLNLVIW